MNNLAIIPARGGSKRIPGKNIKNFLGKPIISYSIETAIRSGLFKEVMVSTDDEKIAEVARKYGATVPFMRSPENADDHATLSDVVEEVTQEYKSRGEAFDYICCILATAPFITKANLVKGFKLLVKQNADLVLPIVRFSYPIQRAVRLQDNEITMFHQKYQKTRSQDLEAAYYDAGQFYWGQFNKGLSRKNRYGFEISRKLSEDIDTLEDWELAEFKYQYFVKE